MQAPEECAPNCRTDACASLDDLARAGQQDALELTGARTIPSSLRRKHLVQLHRSPEQIANTVWAVSSDGVCVGTRLHRRRSRERSILVRNAVRLKNRRLAIAPALVLADGAQGFWSALGEIRPTAARLGPKRPQFPRHIGEGLVKAF